jgi:hypothetical protein
MPVADRDLLEELRVELRRRGVDRVEAVLLAAAARDPAPVAAFEEVVEAAAQVTSQRTPSTSARWWIVMFVWEIARWAAISTAVPCRRCRIRTPRSKLS